MWQPIHLVFIRKHLSEIEQKRQENSVKVISRTSQKFDEFVRLTIPVSYHHHIVVVALIFLLDLCIVFASCIRCSDIVWRTDLKLDQVSRSFTDPVGRSRSEIGLEVTLSIFICLASILDNLLVLYVVYKDSRLKNVTYIFSLQPGIDWHFHGIAVHALLDNRPVNRDLDF